MDTMPKLSVLSTIKPDKDGLAQYEALVDEAAAYLSALAPAPDFALTLGSGLTALLDCLEDVREIPYASIPGFPQAGAPGHQSRLLLAKLAGRTLAVLTGRFHDYEGKSPWEVAFPVRVLSAWGVRRLILTNAAGSVNRAYKPVSLMLISDHIALLADTPLRGPNLERFGPRFPDQSAVYDPEYRRATRAAAEKLGLTLHEGVYFYTRGPVYETPAEIKLIGHLGGDAVGMSTVGEAQVATHSGMRVLGICCLSNWGAGISDGFLSAEEVLAAGRQVGAQLGALLTEVCRTL